MKSKTKKFHKPEVQAPPKELYPLSLESPVEKSDITKAIKLFWWCSSTNQWGWFDFDKFFNFMSRIFKGLLTEQGQSAENVIEIFEDHFDDIESAKKYAESPPGDWLWRDHQFAKLKKEYDKGADTLEKKIQMVDKAIHLQHLTGNVLEYGFDFHTEGPINIPELREDFEKKYIEKTTEDKNELERYG